MGLRTHLVRLGKFEKKARVGCRDKVLLITRARDRLHCAGIEEAVLNETLVDVNADHLTEGNEPWGGIAVDILELDRLQPLAFQRAWRSFHAWRLDQNRGRRLEAHDLHFVYAAGKGQ